MPVMRDVPLPQTAEHRLTRHRRMVLAALLAVAALVRLCVYLELRDGPCLELHRWAESDMHYFHAWGSAIAEGDVLSQSIEPPLHQWHLQIARAAMHADADLGHEVAAAARANGKSRERELWTRWCGFRSFYQEPLYPYLLGAIYALCGNDPALVVWLQMLAGLAALAAVFWLTERYFGLLAATCAGGMTGLCGTLVHHEMLLLRETLLVLCGLLLVLLFERCRDVASNQRRLLFGVLASCALLLKFSFAPLVALLLAMLAHRHGWRATLIPLLTLAFAAFCVLARHLVVDATCFSPASGAAVTFLTSNTSNYDAGRGGLQVTDQVASIMANAGGNMFEVLRETIATHASMLDWLGLMARKVATALQWYDVPDNSNYYYHSLHSIVLSHLPVTPWLVFSCALPGLIGALWRRPRALPLLCLLALQSFLLAAFPVTGRLRLPLVAAAIPFAGLFAAILLRHVRHLSVPGLPSCMAMLAASTWMLGSQLPPATPLIRPVDFFVPMQVYYWPRDHAAIGAGEMQRARELRCEAAELMRCYLDTPFHPQDRRELELRSEAQRINAFGLEAAGDVVGAAEARRQREALQQQLSRVR
jgi:hypothetical protein